MSSIQELRESTKVAADLALVQGLITEWHLQQMTDGTVSAYDMQVAEQVRTQLLQTPELSTTAAALGEAIAAQLQGQSGLRTALENVKDLVTRLLTEAPPNLLVPVQNTDVTDYNNLLAHATTLDWPYAEMAAFSQVQGSDWHADDPDQLALVKSVWNKTFHAGIDYDSLQPDMREYVFRAGGEEFRKLLEGTFKAIDEHAQDGLWVPEDDPVGAELNNRRAEIVQSLIGALDTRPGDFVELRMDVDLSEMSERAVALFDEQTQQVFVLHRNPRG